MWYAEGNKQKHTHKKNKTKPNADGKVMQQRGGPTFLSHVHLTRNIEHLERKQKEKSE